VRHVDEAGVVGDVAFVVGARSILPALEGRRPAPYQTGATPQGRKFGVILRRFAFFCLRSGFRNKVAGASCLSAEADSSRRWAPDPPASGSTLESNTSGNASWARCPCHFERVISCHFAIGSTIWETLRRGYYTQLSVTIGPAGTNSGLWPVVDWKRGLPFRRYCTMP
jgi:hypothetical protein